MKVTVIIPIYNAAKYLDQCIQSVLNQEFTDFELLLINDGSTDNSGTICEGYAAKDGRVKVFHKTNGGVSSARNLGLDNAAGEWVTFIDADDYIQKDYFKVLEIENNGDLILQRLTYVEKGNVIKQTSYQSEKLFRNVFLLKFAIYPYFSSSCSKFFKNKILRKHQINFNEELSYGEDTLFNLRYIQHCKLVEMSDLSGYMYRVSKTGLTNLGYNYQHDLQFYNAFEELVSSYKNKTLLGKAFEIPLSRLSKSIYFDKTIHAVERRRILKQITEAHFNLILKIYTDIKIKIFFAVAYYTGFYSMLDFVLLKLAKRSR